MILDFRDLDADTPIDTDVCVIGAGAAGISIALALAKAPLDVCLLESGGITSDAQMLDLNRGSIVGRSYQPLENTRARYLGGTTNLWLGACTPLNELDFRVRPWVPHSGWPITAADLEPFYRRAQEICELGPYQYGAEVWSRFGFTPPRFDPKRLVPQFWRLSAPTRFGFRYRSDLKAAENLRVMLHANGVELHSESLDTRVRSLSVRSLDGKTIPLRARAYVLAMGGIENPRLLLNSRAAAPAGLGNAHDLVGRYFMEHTLSDAGFFYPADEATDLDPFEILGSPGDHVRPGVRISEEVQRSESVLNSCGRVVSGQLPPTPGWDAVNRLRGAWNAGEVPEGFKDDVFEVLSNLDEVLVGGYGQVVHGDRHRYDEQGFSIFLLSEQAPNPDSRVRLTSERDVLGQQRVALDWKLQEADWRTIGVMARQMGIEFARLGLGRVRISDWLTGDQVQWDPKVSYGHHHAGTTRMADSPKYGVVDPDCKVHGASNVYVAGSSVFPTCGYANPTLTIVALALRLADHLHATLTA